MIMFDIETLGVESTSVVLSAAMIHFRFDELLTYEQYLERAIFVKFDAREQVRIGRTIHKNTLEWWKKQAELPRLRSVEYSDSDVSVATGMKLLRDYIADTGNKGEYVWTRGSLDQLASESLCIKAGVDILAPYNLFRDVRTAIDLTCEGASNGYCAVPGFDPGAKVIKHDPVHDCAYDIMMMIYGT